jgi:hypothetical protein
MPLRVGCDVGRVTRVFQHIYPSKFVFLFTCRTEARFVCGGGMGVAGVVFAEHKGQTFKKDDLVHIFVGTVAGVRAKKTEQSESV